MRRANRLALAYREYLVWVSFFLIVATSVVRDIRHSAQHSETQEFSKETAETAEPAPTGAHSSDVSLDDYSDYSDYSDYLQQEEDDTQSIVSKVEQAYIAPVHLIGSVPELIPGSIIRSVHGSHGFPLGSCVLVSEINNDFYKGFIINSPLPLDEITDAKALLRVEQQEGFTPNLDRVEFFGRGGPVHLRSEWTPIHNGTNIHDSLVVATDIRLNGDISALWKGPSPDPFTVLLVFGAAVWLPGQLEREFSENLWAFHRPLATFDQVRSIALQSVIESS